MHPTVTIEIPAESEALVRRVVSLQQELHALALSAPDGTVLDACETAVIDRGRDLCKQVLADAVARRIETTEKRGPRSAPVRAAGSKRTAVPPRVSM
jgi:hypothetical protein